MQPPHNGLMEGKGDCASSRLQTHLLTFVGEKNYHVVSQDYKGTYRKAKNFKLNLNLSWAVTGILLRGVQYVIELSLNFKGEE